MACPDRISRSSLIDLPQVVRRGVRLSQPMSVAGTSRTSGDGRLESAKWAKADIDQVADSWLAAAFSLGGDGGSPARHQAAPISGC